MQKYFFFLIVLVTSSCTENASKNGTEPIKKNYPLKTIDKQDLQGKWFLNEWTSYRILDFNKQYLSVDNHIDTIFTLGYHLTKDTLITWIDNKEVKNKILELNDSVLVLDGIGSVTETRKYTRKSNR